MKITFTLADDQGREFQGTAVLTQIGSEGKRRASTRKGKSSTGVSFGSNLRAYVKRYAKGKSGAQKFTLLLAFVAKGDESVEVPVSSIAAAWKKTSGLLGGRFQRMYGTLAKERDWAESPKKGVYKLYTDWRDCLAAEEEDA